MKKMVYLAAASVVLSVLGVAPAAFADEYTVQVQMSIDDECFEHTGDGCKPELPTFKVVDKLGHPCLQSTDDTQPVFCPIGVSRTLSDEEELQNLYGEISALRKSALDGDSVANDMAKGKVAIIGSHISGVAADFNRHPVAPELVKALENAKVRLADVDLQIDESYTDLKQKQAKDRKGDPVAPLQN